MDNDNKNRLIEGAKKLALIVYGVLTIGVCAGVWNYCPEKTVCLWALVLGLANFAGIVVLWKKATPKKEKDEKK